MPHPQVIDRQKWMAVLARASATAIQEHLANCAPLPEYTRLRGPELGLAMVQGRLGGAGSPFNLGEMTLCRCTVRTSGGFVGHAYVAGRVLRQAELAAVLHAALQDPVRHDLHHAVITPLAEQQDAHRAAVAAKAAATRVQFSTLATMRS